MGYLIQVEVNICLKLHFYLRCLAVICALCIFLSFLLPSRRKKIQSPRHEAPPQEEEEASLGLEEAGVGGGEGAVGGEEEVETGREEKGQHTWKEFSVLGLIMTGDCLAVMGHYSLYARLDEIDDAYVIMVCLGVGRVMGRLAAGWATTRPGVSPVCLNISGLALASVSSGFYLLSLDPTAPSWTTSWAPYLTSSSFGFSTGIWIASTSPLWIKLLGKSNLNFSFGILTMYRGIGCIVGPFTDQALSFRYLPCVYFTLSTIVCCCGVGAHKIISSRRSSVTNQI